MRTRRQPALVGALALTSAVAAAALAGPAGAGDQVAAPVTIEKDAVGATPGTVFTIELSCTGTPIIPPDNSAPVSSLEFTFTVDDTGTAQPDGVNTVGFVNEAECTVTETDSGGASTTSYTCADNGAELQPPTQLCTTSGPQAEPISFLVEDELQEVLVTVTNTFDPPPPAPQPIELEPAFTG